MKTVLSKIIITLTLASLLFSSCSLEKRRYSSGYHVEWHNNKTTAEKHSKRKSSTPDEVVVTDSKEETVSVTPNDSVVIAEQLEVPIVKEKVRKQSNNILEKLVAQNLVYKSFIKVSRKPLQKIGYSIKPLEVDDPVSEPVEKTLLTRGLISALFGLLALIMIALLYAGIGSGGFLAIAIPFVIWLGAVIAGLVMGIWGTVEFGMEPVWNLKNMKGAFWE